MSLQQPKSWTHHASRELKIALFRARRSLLWTFRSADYPRPVLGDPDAYPVLLASKRVPLRRRDPDAHPLLEAGKIVNLQIAAPCFDGLDLSPGRPLSFWRTLGPISERRGYRHGMEVRAGCVVPSLGGGICLLSNALFELAVRLDWRILERHGHTVEAVPSWSRPWGLDATVFWPYVDLRVEPRLDCLLRCRVENECLRIEVFARKPWTGRVELESRNDTIESGVRSNEVWRRRFLEDGSLAGEELVAQNRRHLLSRGSQRRRNCLTCGETGCRARVTLDGEGDSA